MKIYEHLEQGTEEWLEARRGILTASVIGKLITPKTMKVASNDTARALIRTLAAERITGHIEPVYVTADMEFWQMIEPIARQMYAEWQNVEVREVGFITRQIDGHTLGYSPDGLDRKSTRLNSSHVAISYAVFCLKKKNKIRQYRTQ